MIRKVALLVFSCIVINTASASNVYTEQQLDSFIQKFSLKYKLPPKYIRSTLSDANFIEASYRSQASYKPTQKAKKKPVIGKTWAKYRSQFLNPYMINKGADFVCQHKKDFKLAEKTYGVPQEIMAGIIGIETSYGGFTGNYRVLDTLSTIAFNIERRNDFFQDELAQYLLMCYQYDLDPTEMKGSIDGGFGLSQFMPSSYMKFAVSSNNDTPNLFLARDAILSVANYIKEHGWKTGHPVVLNVTRAKDTCSKLECNQKKLTYPLYIFEKNGVKFNTKINPHEKGDLVTLSSDKYNKNAYVALNNYYVIFSYNHSLYYSMAVYQLGVAVVKQARLAGCD